MRTLLAWLSLALALASFGALPAQAASTPRSSRAAVAPPGNLSDAQIEQDLRARLSRSKLATRQFKFRVQGGVATLDGRTDVIQHKGIMTRMAKSAGARAVVNRIEISEAARQRAADRLEQGRRKAAVKHQPVRNEGGAK